MKGVEGGRRKEGRKAGARSCAARDTVSALQLNVMRHAPAVCGGEDTKHGIYPFKNLQFSDINYIHTVRGVFKQRSEAI